jgi:hypothetical protein
MRGGGHVKRTALASFVVVIVAFAATDVAAQYRGGGGSRGGGGGSRGGGWHGGGGGWHGGGHAVPRSGYGHVPSGGAAYARHPRGGTGAYGYGHGGYYGHGYKPYYGYYRPYYPYYYPDYSPWYASFYWGWPYYAPGVSVGLSYGPVSVSGTYAPAPSYSVGTPEMAPAPRESRPAEPEADWGRVRLEVRPEDASVYVDDSFRGTARQARGLRLTPGRHTIELARPGFAVERREVEVVEGESVDVFVEMQPSGRPPA